MIRDCPSGFVERVRGWQHALVREDSADIIAAALWDGTGCVPATKRGRGALLRFPCASGFGLIRPYLRGGLIRHVVRDRYFLANRPLRELRLHARVFEAGLSVPEPLGIRWSWQGPFVRGAFASREVEAINLLEYVRTCPDDIPDTMRHCGALVRHMHDLKVWHADLQVRNILVGNDRLYLLDFDNARLTSGLTRLERARNLFRLRRSLQKNGISLDHFESICEGYGDEALPGWAGRVYRVKGRLADLASGRDLPHDPSSK